MTDNNSIDTILSDYIKNEPDTDFSGIQESASLKLADRCFGYMLASLSSAFFLIFMLPKLFAMLNQNDDPTLGSLLTLPLDFAVLLMVVSFVFITGVGLFHSYRPAKTAALFLSVWLFVYWIRLIAAELLFYSIHVSFNSEKLLLLFFATILLGSLYYLIYRAYTRPFSRIVKPLSTVNIILTLLNSTLIAHIFFSFRPGKNIYSDVIVWFLVSTVIFLIIQGIRTFTLFKNR